MLADGAIMQDVISTVAEGAVALGCAVLKGTSPRQGKPVSAVTASTTSILDGTPGGATAATAQTVSGAAFDGTIGQGRIIPAQQITLTANSHANWDATVITFYGEDCDGREISEDVLMPDAGNVTIETKQAFGRLVSVYIPAQGGTAGTFTIGTKPAFAEFSRRDLLGASIWQSAHEPYTSDSYSDKDEMPVLRKGRMYVVVEDAVANGDNVYVRIVTSGGDVPGQFGGERSASFALVRGAFYRSTAAIDGVAVVEL
jgi:hypothetical protein